MAAGFDPAAFWSLSLREYALHLDGWRKRADMDHAADRWRIWHQAALTRCKALPSFGKFAGHKPQAKRQTPEQIEAAFYQMAAALGAVRQSSPDTETDG